MLVRCGSLSPRGAVQAWDCWKLHAGTRARGRSKPGAVLLILSIARSLIASMVIGASAPPAASPWPPEEELCRAAAPSLERCRPEASDSASSGVSPRCCPRRSCRGRRGQARRETAAHAVRTRTKRWGCIRLSTVQNNLSHARARVPGSGEGPGEGRGVAPASAARPCARRRLRCRAARSAGRPSRGTLRTPAAPKESTIRWGNRIRGPHSSHFIS